MGQFDVLEWFKECRRCGDDSFYTASYIRQRFGIGLQATYKQLLVLNNFGFIESNGLRPQGFRLSDREHNEQKVRHHSA